MQILLIEPYMTGSHQTWAKGLQLHSKHDIEIFSLEGRYWKWRMHGGAISLAKKFIESSVTPDLILATDMLDLTTFLALSREKSDGIPTAAYFHENQLTYPWSDEDRDVQAGRDNHYGFINYSTALAADRVYYNSPFHLESFLGSLPNFLKGFPDHNELMTVDQIREKSKVLSLGMDLAKFDGPEDRVEKNEIPVLLWNHRWEYDKNPEDFFRAMYQLKEDGVAFKLIIVGENFSKAPRDFDEARSGLEKEILQFGFAESAEDYAGWLQVADIIPVTSNQDFFGGSIVEAMCNGVIPLLPDRLAYPEHIPDNLKPQLLYKSQDDFVIKLKALIENRGKLDKKALHNHIIGYDWSSMAPKYDQELSSLLRPK